MKSQTNSSATRKGPCLVLALDSYGDLVLRQPLLSGLADAGYAVHLLVRTGYERILPLLEPRVNWTSADLRYDFPPEENQFRGLVEQLRSLEPSLVVNAQYDPIQYVNWLMASLPGATKVGFVGGRCQEVPGARRLEERLELPAVSLDREVVCPDSMCEIEKARHLLASVVGKDAHERAPTIALREELLVRAREIVESLGLSEGRFVICCPGGTANVSLKAWPAENYAEIVSRLVAQKQQPVLLAGHRSDEYVVREVARLSGCDEGSVGTWIGEDEELDLMVTLCAMAKLYIGNDSGPMHFAAASGVPVISPFGGGHWPRFVPQVRPAAIHTIRLPCFGCEWRNCFFGEALCVRRVHVDAIWSSVLEILDGGREVKIHEGNLPLGDEAVRLAVAEFRKMSAESDLRLEAIHARDCQIARTTKIIDEQDAELSQMKDDLRRLEPLARAGSYAPLVSVITPVFNAGRWIERCIQSVRDQDYPRIEHIIVDGGSTDETLEICERHPELVLYSAPDRGQSHAINRGFEMARGQILAWLCADDEYRPGAVSSAVEAIRNGSELVVGHCDFIDADGRTIAPHPANSFPYFDHHMLLRFWRFPTIPQPSTFWRRGLWERCGPLREDLYFTMDYDLWLRMTKVTAFTSVPHSMSSYRIHSDAKCFADNYGSRVSLIRVSRSYWPSRWRASRWALAFEHRFSTGPITQHYADAERFRDRALECARRGKRLAAVNLFLRMHFVHPASPKLPGYHSLLFELTKCVTPAWLRALRRRVLRFIQREAPS